MRWKATARHASPPGWTTTCPNRSGRMHWPGRSPPRHRSRERSDQMTDDRVVIDPAALDRLLEMTGGDPEFVQELITTYVEDAAAQLDAMRAADAAGDAEALVRPAHSLK